MYKGLGECMGRKRIRLDVPSFTRRLKQVHLEGVELFSPNEAGGVLGVTGEAVKQWIHGGRLHATRQGNGFWKIRLHDLENFISGRAANRPRVLLVGGNLDETATIQLGLNGLADTITSSHFIDAVVKLTSVRPTAVIVDVERFSDGWKFIKYMGKLPNHNTKVALIMPAAIDEQGIQQAIKANALACLTRPLSTSQIEHELSQILRA